jgi:hypothetical protein
MPATNPSITTAVRELDAIADRLLDVHGQLALAKHPLARKALEISADTRMLACQIEAPVSQRGQSLADQTRRVLASAEPAAPSDARPVIVVPVLPSRANRGDT